MMKLNILTLLFLLSCGLSYISHETAYTRSKYIGKELRISDLTVVVPDKIYFSDKAQFLSIAGENFEKSFLFNMKRKFINQLQKRSKFRKISIRNLSDITYDKDLKQVKYGFNDSTSIMMPSDDLFGLIGRYAFIIDKITVIKDSHKDKNRKIGNVLIYSHQHEADDDTLYIIELDAYLYDIRRATPISYKKLMVRFPLQRILNIHDIQQLQRTLANNAFWDMPVKMF